MLRLETDTFIQDMGSQGLQPGTDSPQKVLGVRPRYESLVSTSLLAFRYSNLLVQWVYTAAASWLGILYLFILAAIFSWIFYGLARLFHLPPCHSLTRIV